MKLGTVIRRYRIMSELSLRDVGKEIGIGAATLMRLEQGRETDSGTIAKVLAWLFSNGSINETKGTVKH
jgi:DNA-binding XRE family transcriptional regulator